MGVSLYVTKGEELQEMGDGTQRAIRINLSKLTIWFCGQSWSRTAPPLGVGCGSRKTTRGSCTAFWAI